MLWSCERRGAALRESKAAQNTKVGGRKGALYIFIFIISILKTNYFFFPAEKGEEEEGGGRVGRGGGGVAISPSFLPLFSLLSSPYFSTDVKMIEIPAGLITAALQRAGGGLKVFK